MGNSNNRVLITGASRGIGRAIAVELAGAGYAVTINYRQRREEYSNHALHCNRACKTTIGPRQTPCRPGRPDRSTTPMVVLEGDDGPGRR
ncbi:MAG: SDR family NAD(P)-dependent oxidoreductase [Gemmatimonadetes bacterium]|nr:SDR family NAD(P)-dependent oxidoreductase [Gemmatimonadota bacterium]